MLEWPCHSSLSHERNEIRYWHAAEMRMLRICDIRYANDNDKIKNVSETLKVWVVTGEHILRKGFATLVLLGRNKIHLLSTLLKIHNTTYIDRYYNYVNQICR